MTHFHRISTTDPISGHDIPDVEGMPYVVEGDHYNDLTIYFESEANRQEYLQLKPLSPAGEGRLHEILNNPAPDMNDSN